MSAAAAAPVVVVDIVDVVVIVVVVVVVVVKAEKRGPIPTQCRCYERLPDFNDVLVGRKSYRNSEIYRGFFHSAWSPRHML